MAPLHSFPTLLLALASAALLVHAQAADDPKAVKLKFTGSPSCSSTSCHGGGTGRNESLKYERGDVHWLSSGILGKGTSLRIAEALGIVGEAGNDARCNVCHAPLRGVPLERLTNEALDGLKTHPLADKGVSCETCHGPAENWLLFHTRRDVNFQQIVATGMRDMNDLYGRANTCVACHLNLDDRIRSKGHPELFFELDRQALAEPPHYKDERPSLGPRQWLTGQAAALRELSWKLAKPEEAKSEEAKGKEALKPRWKALVWLLRKTDAGKRDLPQSEDFGTVKTAADQLARNAAKTLWTKEQVGTLLKDYIGLHAEFSDPKADQTDLRRRAEVLVPAIDRLWRAYKKEAGTESATFEPALEEAYGAALQGEDFKPKDFASKLKTLEDAYPKGAK